MMDLGGRFWKFGLKTHPHISTLQLFAKMMAVGRRRRLGSAVGFISIKWGFAS